MIERMLDQEKAVSEKYLDPTTVAWLDMASLVDPRFKTQYSDKKEEVQARAISEPESLLNVHAQQQSSTEPPSTSQRPVEKVYTPPRKVKILASYFSGDVYAGNRCKTESLPAHNKCRYSSEIDPMNGGDYMRETFKG